MKITEKERGRYINMIIAYLIHDLLHFFIVDFFAEGQILKLTLERNRLDRELKPFRNWATHTQ